MGMRDQLPAGAGSGGVHGGVDLAVYVLARMKGLWPDRLRVKLATAEAVQLFVATMRNELARRRVSAEMVEVGLARIASECEWPVVDVPVFIRYCLPVRDYAAAFDEAQRFAMGMSCGRKPDPADLSHPAVYWAADRFGWRRLRNSSAKEAAARWQLMLDEVLDWGEWPTVDVPRVTTAEKLQTAAARESAMAEARRLLRGVAAGSRCAPGFERQPDLPAVDGAE